MDEDPIVQMMKEIALELGVNIPFLDRENEMNAGAYHIIPLEKPVDHAAEALRLDRIAKLAKSQESYCTCNGQDLYGSILTNIFDAFGMPSPGDDNPFNRLG
jgi:hypothetical protein